MKHSLVCSSLALINFVAPQVHAQAIAPVVPEPTPSATKTPSDWRISAGFGVVSAPKYSGANKQRWLVIPNVDVRYKDWFFASPVEGIGAQTSYGDLTLSGAFGIDFNSRDRKDSTRLTGLSKTNVAPAVKLRAGYDVGDFNVSAALSSRIGSAKAQGNSVELQLGYNAIATRKLLTTIGVTTRWVDQKYAENLISISPADSLRSGLPVYKADKGVVDAGIFVQSLYRISDDWTVFSRLQFSQLHGDARYSPIVERKNQLTAALFASYTF
jgi:MipA family protein